MKKTLTTLTLITGLALSSYGQGYLFFDSGASAAGAVSINGVLDTGTDVNLTLVNQTLGTTVATLLLSDGSAIGDITSYGNGQIYDLSGLSYIADNGTAGTYSFVVQGWLGSTYNSFGAAVAAGAVLPSSVSAPFSELTIAPPSAPGGLDAMGNMNIVTTPEPSTLALAGIGAAMLIIRRRK
jgi:hypothetical protein